MYFITAFQKLPSKDSNVDYGCSRCFGYYKNLKNAQDSVESNYCNIFEYLYEYCFIEEIGEGIHPYVTNRWLYKFNHEIMKYEIIENEPEELAHLINFTLG